MKQKALGILITLLVFFSALVCSLFGAPSAYSEPFQGEIPTRLQFNRTVVVLKGGEMFSGQFVGLQNSDLIVRVGTTDVPVPLHELHRVTIEMEKDLFRPALCGMSLAAYLGNFLMLRAKGQPGAYIEDGYATGGIVIWNIIFGAAGGGLGLLAGSIAKNGEQIFDFSGGEEKEKREQGRLRRFLLGEDASVKKLHISVQAAQVYPRVSETYMNLLKQNDYPVFSYAYWDHMSWQSATDFNLLRRLQLTYSLSRRVEIGVAGLWLGEPACSGYRYEYSEHSVVSQRVVQALDIMGVYVVGVFKPLGKTLPKSISWNIGVGAGAAKTDFRLNAEVSAWDSIVRTYTEDIFEQGFSKTLFGGYVFTELNLFLQTGLSVGLTADYAYLSEQQALAIEEADIPAQKLRLGNTSIGFNLGFHF